MVSPPPPAPAAAVRLHLSAREMAAPTVRPLLAALLLLGAALAVQVIQVFNEIGGRNIFEMFIKYVTQRMAQYDFKVWS